MFRSTGCVRIPPARLRSLILLERCPLTTTTHEDSEAWAVGDWLKGFTRDRIPKECLEVSYSRSSGPGGQNVNKVNTKVDMRIDVPSAWWLPDLVKQRLQLQHSNKINKSNQFIISSDRFRTQTSNYDDCLTRLYDTIRNVAEECVPKEADEEKVARIEEFKALEKEKKMKAKVQKSSKKAARRGNDY